MWWLAGLLLLAQADYTSEGMKALEEGRYDAAVTAFGKATAEDPKDYFAHFNLAMAYTLLHRDAEAVASYRRTLEIKPGLYEAELNAGIVLLRPAGVAPARAPDPVATAAGGDEQVASATKPGVDPIVTGAAGPTKKAAAEQVAGAAGRLQRLAARVAADEGDLVAVRREARRGDLHELIHRDQDTLGDAAEVGQDELVEETV